MPTSRGRSRQVEKEDIDLMYSDGEEDYIAHWDDTEDTILASTGNATTYTARTKI